MSIKIFSRGKGASVICKQAYRAGERLESEYDGRTHDYSKKPGIIYKEIMLPENAPHEYKNRSVLWNAVEKIEKQSNAQLGREVEISLPVELTKEQNIKLARKFAYDTFVKDGMCADICVHDTGKGNPHAHITLTMRPFDEHGNLAAKSKKEYILDKNGEKILLKSGEYKTRKINTTDWNEREKSEYWRKKWAEYQNKALAHYGHSARVDHRSYERQGIDQIPTVHMGVAAHLEAQGIRTEQGDRNRQIDQWNRELRMIKGRIKKLKTWLYNQPIEDAPDMGDILRSITANNHLKSQAQKIQDLKTLSNLVVFLKENELGSIDQLTDKIESMHQEQSDIAGKIKKQDKRFQTLETHLLHVEAYNKSKGTYKRYTELKPKEQAAFKEKYAAALKQHDIAHKYLKDHLNGRITIPEKSWREERAEIISNRYTLAEKYYNLKSEVKHIEILRKSAERIIDRAAPIREQIRRRSNEWEL